MRRSLRLTLPYLFTALVLTAATLLLSFRSFLPQSISVPTAAVIHQKPRFHIILDAGHGGEDGGAEAHGAIEKDINLAVVKDMREYLRLSDIEVSLTREDDSLLYDASKGGSKKKQDIDNRIAFAKNIDGAVFVSIHQNKFEIEKYHGLQVYFSPHDPFSETIASRLQDADKALLEPNNNRAYKKAGRSIRVLYALDIPAVLVECAFLSNPSDAAKMQDEAYRKKLAFVLSMTLLDTLYAREKGE